MIRGLPTPFRVFARGPSLRRRVAYSLATVRLILVPVILLAVYYLFAMGKIVDQIVSVNAPVATLAQRASVEMLEARRAEKNYLLLHDPEDLVVNQQALARLDTLIATCAELQPQEAATVAAIRRQIETYRRYLQEVVRRMGEPGQAPLDRVQEVVRAYVRDLEELLRRSRTKSRGELVEELRARVGSFDLQIAATLGTEDPALARGAEQLRASSEEILRLTGELEKRGWQRVERDHAEARALMRRAEWVLLIVSALTILVSVAASFVLPRQVVKPLVDLKAAVDHAAAGNYEIEFDVQGEAEVVQLADSVRNLIAHVREKKNNSGSSATR
jgi:methyl-accepting chemotaxis protein